jgi:hypothetical protein
MLVFKKMVAGLAITAMMRGGGGRTNSTRNFCSAFSSPQFAPTRKFLSGMCTTHHPAAAADDNEGRDDVDIDLDIDDMSPQEIADIMKQPSFEPSSAGALRPKSLDETEPIHIHVNDNFLSDSLSKCLRGKFVDHFSDSRQGNSDRFCFDYWHVPDQYTLLRTPADHFFGEELFGELAESICSYGQRCLGTSSISPPWLSLYVENCEQKWHVDGWHGPWAYVLSLSSDPLLFTGGETQILKPHVLDYWSSMPTGVGLEMPHLMDRIKPEWNRLSVFDPRLPHSVSPVRGTMDPLRGRLVIHGWFTDPQPHFEGGLEAQAELAEATIGDALDGLDEEMSDLSRLMGTLAIRISVSGTNGKVTRLEVLSDTLVPDPTEPDGWGARAAALNILGRRLLQMQFSTAEADSFVTIPFMFE